MVEIRISPEECARRILERELGRPVVLHDDGSQSSMYDLRIGQRVAPDIAIECVAAVDPIRTATWNEGPGRGVITVESPADWSVVLRPHARVKPVRSRLAEIIKGCEEANIDGFTPVDSWLRGRAPDLHALLDRLRIASVASYVPGIGKVYLGMTGLGGAVDTEGSFVAEWLSEFLRAETRKDVLDKLSASGAAECHVFIPVSFGGVPWLVESYLGTHTKSLPPSEPELPSPVEAVWIMYGRRGLRWDGKAWSFFDALVPAQ